MALPLDRLRALSRDDKDRRDLLWTDLTHQGTVSAAAYAALPHVVEIAAASPPEEALELWVFAGLVASATRPPEMPLDGLDAYEQSVRRAEELVRGSFVPGRSERSVSWLAVALAGLRHEATIATAVEALIDLELSSECPGGDELYVALERLPYVVRGDLSDRQPERKTVARTVAPRPAVADLAGLVRHTGHDGLAERILALDALVTCPGCGEELLLLDL